MATIYQTTDIITVNFAVTAFSSPGISSGDTFIVPRGVSVVSTTHTAFYNDYRDIALYTIRIEGTVHGARAGISWDEYNPGDEDLIVTVGPEGSLSGGFWALNTRFPSDLVLSNQGTVSGHYGSHFWISDKASVANSGLIEAVGSDVPTGALNFNSVDFADVLNSGTIRTATATDTGSFDVAAVQFKHTNPPGSEFHMANTGVISGLFQSVYSNARINRIDNSGLLDGDVVLDFGNHALGNAATGRILGDITANGLTNLVNQGTIEGDVTFTSIFGDTYRGLGGTVTGTISTDGGNDVFHVDQPDIVIADSETTDSDTIFLHSDLSHASNIELIEMQGAAGLRVIDDDSATRINGNAGDNAISGAGGNDTLRGAQGLDELSGGDGDDVIIGNSGNDEIDGGAGLDTIFGGVGNDRIEGGFGADSLVGGAGDDVILPGRGQDKMAGGHGADTFVFGDALDAGSGSSADRIDNFARGEDLIDLIALGTTPASFIGTAGFSGGGNMEVRYTVNPFGNALVRIDEDGNGTEDARIVVAQTALLDAADFLL